MGAHPRLGPTPPALSLVVSTRHRRSELSRLLDSLARQGEPDFEVIVVDQNPPGYLDGLLTDTGLRLRQVSSGPGLSLGRNTGLQLASGALVGFPDDDCWYEPGTVRRIVEAFEADPHLGVLLGRTVDASGRESLGRFMPRSGPVDRYNVWRAGNSNSLFARLDLALALGGFDETLGVGAPTPFQSGEETDFTLRVLLSGAEVRFRHDLTICHDQVEELIAAPQIDRARRYSQGFGRVLRKHRYGLAYVASRVARPLARSALALASGSPKLAAYKAVWALGTARGYLSGRGTEQP